MTELYRAIVDRNGLLAPHSAAELVPWWSFTKTMIAACALRLVQEGRLELDAAPPGMPYTLRQLLAHRAGVGDYGALRAYHEAVAHGDEPWSEAELLDHVPPDRLLFNPGERFAYSNIGYLLIRRPIEQAAGLAFADALGLLVLAPLGLSGSRLAVSRADMAATVFSGERSYDPRWVYHGTIIGPVTEAALGLHRLLHGDLLDSAVRAVLLERHPVDPGMAAPPWVDAGYGHGLMIGTMARSGMSRPLAVLGHSAGGPGSVGAVYARLDGSRTVAVFAADGHGSSIEDLALQGLVSG